MNLQEHDKPQDKEVSPKGSRILLVENGPKFLQLGVKLELEQTSQSPEVEIIDTLANALAKLRTNPPGYYSAVIVSGFGGNFESFVTDALAMKQEVEGQENLRIKVFTKKLEYYQKALALGAEAYMKGTLDSHYKASEDSWEDLADCTPQHPSATQLRLPEEPDNPQQ